MGGCLGACRGRLSRGGAEPPPAYNVSKAALNALTRMLASDLRRDRILVNAVCPGWVATDMGGPGGRPVAEGGASILWAIDLPDDGPTGGFYRDGHPLPGDTGQTHRMGGPLSPTEHWLT